MRTSRSRKTNCSPWRVFDSEEFVRNESKFAGEIRACVELPAGFNVLLKEVSDQLTDLYQAIGGAVVLFSWVQFLKEDALKFLDIHTLLELPSEEHSLQEPSNAALLEQRTINPSKVRTHNLCKPDLSERSLEEENPRVFLTDGHDHSNQISSDASEAKQISEFTADHQNDLSSAAGKLKHGQEEFLNEGDVSASLLLSSSSSDPLDQSEQGAASLPPHSSESSQNEDQTLSGLSLIPSQTLLSQLLIHNAAQKQKMFATTVFDCGVCFEGWLGSDCVQLPECGQIFCRACLGKFCKLQIKEGNVRGVTCPDADCPATPTPAQMWCTALGLPVVRPSLWRSPAVPPSALCAALPSASAAGRPTMEQKKGLMALWDDYASGSKQRQRLLENRYGRKIMRETVEDCLSEDWIVFNSKNCPHCFCRIQVSRYCVHLLQKSCNLALIARELMSADDQLFTDNHFITVYISDCVLYKNRGCNMMTCSKCLNRFCWACLDRLQTGASQHFVDSRCAADYREY
ncbi:hypothetical protein F7725_027985 [Dissostichus mawsoni]|uniref:RBR-type E3 ubiquitin transferase n=1 Tax=Dissostichus mawsoni TaxID=36200 RepID=A0A7J5XFQ5_DISMA|nr:hypothetical protein F7725_027985 [Dissostichus mawsoni]